MHIENVRCVNFIWQWSLPTRHEIKKISVSTQIEFYSRTGSLRLMRENDWLFFNVCMNGAQIEAGILNLLFDSLCVLVRTNDDRIIYHLIEYQIYIIEIYRYKFYFLRVDVTAIVLGSHNDLQI